MKKKTHEYTSEKKTNMNIPNDKNMNITTKKKKTMNIPNEKKHKNMNITTKNFFFKSIFA